MCASNTRSVSTAVSLLLTVLSNIPNLGTLRSDGSLRASGASLLELPSAKVGKGACTTTELDDPFGISQAQTVAHVAVGGADALAGGQVLKRRRARAGRGSVDSHAKTVAALDGEPAAVVDRRVGPPLVPGGDGAVAEGLHTGLENGATTVGT